MARKMTPLSPSEISRLGDALLPPSGCRFPRPGAPVGDLTIDEMYANYARNTSPKLDTIRGTYSPEAIMASPEKRELVAAIEGAKACRDQDLGEAWPPPGAPVPVAGLVDGEATPTLPSPMKGEGVVEGLVAAARRAMAFIGDRKFATAEAHLRSALEVWDRAGVK